MEKNRARGTRWLCCDHEEQLLHSNQNYASPGPKNSLSRKPVLHFRIAPTNTSQTVKINLRSWLQLRSSAKVTLADPPSFFPSIIITSFGRSQMHINYVINVSIFLLQISRRTSSLYSKDNAGVNKYYYNLKSDI